MKRQYLLENLKQGISHIHDNVFPDIDVNEIINEENEYVIKALDKYTQYINYTENQDKYNLKYCFKTTIQDLNDFYDFQEKKLDQIESNERLCELEHKVNVHIYDEVSLCQKKVNRLFMLNTITAYLLAFLLIFLVTEVTHMFEFSTLLGGTVVALVMALVKIVIDKKYLEVIRVRVGWKSYRLAITRSLAFYFASVVIINHCEHYDLSSLDDETMIDLKNQVRSVIDILLEEVILHEQV